MSKKAKSKKVKKKTSSSRMLFLSFLLLFIVLEAIFIMKNENQKSLALKANQQVAGASSHR